MRNLTFLDNNGTFRLEKAQNYSYLYFPIASGTGLKSAVTPELLGDAKTDQNHFLLQPESAEELHNNKSSRNFWVRFDNGKYFSATGVSALQQADKFTKRSENITVEAGLMWQKVIRENKKFGLKSEITSFVPVGTECEIMKVTLTNTTDKALTFTPVAAVPIYGRSADNLRDHRHVTSLLHRIYVTDDGVCVQPVLSFDERGHQKNFNSYFVAGADEKGAKPEGFYPIVENYIGEGGSFEVPEAVVRLTKPETAGFSAEGYEAVGALRFAEKTLKKGESASYIVLIGFDEADKPTDVLSKHSDKIIKAALKKFGDLKKADKALEDTKAYWIKENNISFHTGDENFDNYMKWISFQPILRRIYGCSFLPHHDYGKGGRGWRDLWQDQLALLMMNPKEVGEMLLNNYCGVRMDGSNATIIGQKPGEFVADRNNITRVWMDHGLWPYMTTDLYIHQTGDSNLLFKPAVYFKDKQAGRGTVTDTLFDESQGTKQLDIKGKVYEGTVLEHILVQNLTAFFEVGEHNHMRLRGADWNDALDMAADRGESVAFTAAYAGNLEDLSVLLKYLRDEKKIKTVELLKEMVVLLEDKKSLYDSIEKKTDLLNGYTKSVEHTVSGEKEKVDIDLVIDSLHNKAEWLKKHIRKTEWLEGGWYNSYYDNSGRAVEGVREDGSVRMMLTGQVFTVMSGTATDKQVRTIAASADKYLYFKERGGYALNTDFHELKTDLGRMFGFGYGHKENGAVFSHMTTMYGNALYKRGVVQKGYKALDTLYRQASNLAKSDIYPGIPEYFNDKGRGMYHYLTGAASWYLLTVLTQMFGVKGYYGDMVLEPKLTAKQFDGEGKASVTSLFGGRDYEVEYVNASKAEYGKYRIASVSLDGKALKITEGACVLIPGSDLEKLSKDKLHKITVTLK
ncbi:MAG: cellobiose phosphorylase [Lachnospiraceae bacterium]|nr:cellobiose phosphorylase [Lachnospiraceae bacterium]